MRSQGQNERRHGDSRPGNMGAWVQESMTASMIDRRRVLVFGLEGNNTRRVARHCRHFVTSRSPDARRRRSPLPLLPHSFTMLFSCYKRSTRPVDVGRRGWEEDGHRGTRTDKGRSRRKSTRHRVAWYARGCSALCNFCSGDDDLPLPLPPFFCSLCLSSPHLLAHLRSPYSLTIFFLHYDFHYDRR